MRGRRVVVAALAVGALACGGRVDPPSRPSAILISLDTLRADRLGCYGYSRPTTPALDRLAAQGVLFERMRAPSPWTIPSHASLFTGLLPARHGMQEFRSRLDAAVPTLAETLRAAGWQTAAFVNTPFLGPGNGLGRGFDHLRDFPKVDARKRQVLNAEAALAEARAWIESRRARPFFVFLHTYDVHSDYQPGPRYRDEFVRPYDGAFDGRSVTLRSVLEGRLRPTAADVGHASDLYDGAIRQLDDRLGAFFAWLDASGLADTTYVVVTSDHGEEFLEHGSVMHGYTLYEEMLRVPLLVRGPRVPAGVRVGEVADSTDVAPTLLALLGAPALAAADGRDLARTWSGAPASEARPAFAESYPRRYFPDVVSHLVSVREGALKLIHDRTTRRSSLYDVEADPAETRDLASERPEDVQRLLARTEAYEATRAAAGQTHDVDPTQVEQLRALGYAQ